MTASPTGLRARLSATTATPLVAAGVGTPLEAELATSAGFDVIYLSGYAVAAWRYGVPDIGLIALEEIAGALEAVTSAVQAQVICDADTGYGDVAGVARTVRRLEARGASAIQLEDQAWPKRCGHLDGKVVIPAEEHARKIAAAVAARESSDTVIIARTDALAPEGLTAALERCRRYADAGADMLFVDAPPDLASIEKIAQTLGDYPLLANMSESGVSPQLSAAQWHEFGYTLVIFPTSALRVAARTLAQFYDHLRRTGDSRAWLERMASLEELNGLVGLRQIEQFDANLSGGGRE
jgi:2-methylisocitrate lyase-like PEP mutase family enzyme